MSLRCSFICEAEPELLEFTVRLLLDAYAYPNDAKIITAANIGPVISGNISELVIVSYERNAATASADILKE